MPESGDQQDVEVDKGQQLLNELHGIRIGLEQLSLGVSDLTEVIAVAADVEMVDENGSEAEDDGGTGSETGDAFNELGKNILRFFRSRREESPDGS